MGVFFLVLLSAIPIAALIGFFLIILALAIQINTRRKGLEKRDDVYKMYIWGFSLLGFSIVAAISIYKFLYWGIGATVV